jgi:hypothetical protein
MVAPAVAVDRLTVCAEGKRPGKGEKTGVATVFGGVLELERTVIFRPKFSWTFLPQHLTCRTCVPVGAVTCALKDMGTIVVGPWSIEYPIETAGFESHTEVLAVRVNGDVS